MRVRGLLAVVVALSISSTALAFDAEAAKKYVQEALELIARQNYEDATRSLELAETELDGVDAAAKAEIEKAMAGARKQIADANSSADKAKYTRALDRAMREIEGSIGNLVTWKGAAAELEGIFNDPRAQAAIGPEIDAAKKKYETFKKLNAKKAGAQITEGLDAAVAELEASWAEAKKTLADADASPNSRESAVTDILRDVEGFKRRLGDLPKDDPKYAGYETKMNAIVAEATAAAGSAQRDEVLNNLKRFWEMDGSYFEGWEKETAGPTWAEFSKQVSENMSAFNGKQSAALVSRIDNFLSNRTEDESYKAVANDPQIKAFIDDVKTKQEQAKAKLLKFATAVVEGAEKETVTPQNTSEFMRLNESLRYVLGDSNPQGQALRARVQAKLDAHEQATVGAAKELDEWYKKSKESAAAKWPEMKAKFTTSEGFDPNDPGAFKGKLIRIDTDNLMGYRFKPGDFKFATTLGGIPVAGRYSPTVAGAIEEIETKLKRGLGDNDDDGRWEIIARVEGNTGQLMARKTAEGDLTVDGQKVGTVTTDYSEPVTAPIITILAAHVGPLAVADGQGVVSSDGSVAAAPAASGSSGSTGSGSSIVGLLTRVVHVGVGLVAAAAALLAAGFKPTPKVGEVGQQLGGKNIAYIGLACVAWGVLWLLVGLVYRGFLVNAAIIAAGGYAALGMLEGFGIIKPDLAAKIKPLGIPIGLACAAIVVLSLFIGGRFVII